MLSDDSIVAIVTAVIGSGGLGGLTGWFSQHLAKRKSILTRDDLQPIKEKLDRDFEHFRQVDDQVRDIKLIVLRQCLFARPRDQNAFTSALQSGEEYLRMGGNGVGHIRLDQLKREYEIRDELHDWNPDHKVTDE